MNFSILGETRNLMDDELIRDLNLDQLIDDINQEIDDYDLTPLFTCLPISKQVTQFRQEIFLEIDDELETMLWHFYQGIHQSVQMMNRFDEMKKTECKAYQNMIAAYTYFDAFESLVSELSNRTLRSDGWTQFLKLCNEIQQTEAYQNSCQKVQKCYELATSLRYTFRIEGDHLAILSEVSEEDLLGELSRKYPQMFPIPNQIPNLLEVGLESGLLEEKINQYLQKKNPQVFSAIHSMLEIKDSFFHPLIMQFHKEISFYLSYLKFYKYMKSSDYSFCMPEFVSNDVNVIDGYDLSLAYKNQLAGTETISNDYYFKDSERFYVVTGPNQGGKTTFGRAAGQLVYFSLLGLPVPARKAKLPYFDGIMTLFSVEESMESGRGKLKEELARLAPMMSAHQTHQFVIINELFTSAATFDGVKMGQLVMEHFLANDCYGIYVTHVDELARETSSVVSMVASLHEMNRTYKVTRQKADGRGYVEPLVEQFGLSYDSIIRRLSHV